MKPTFEETTIANEIIDDLIKHDFFNTIICEDSDELYFWSLENRDYLRSNHITVHSGETKICIVSDKLPNWVIKVGFIFSDGVSADDYDYCTTEAENFEEVVKEGLEEFFAAIYKLRDIVPPDHPVIKRAIPFYIQERAEPDEEKTSTTCSEYTGNDDNDDYDRVECLFGKSGRIDELFDFINFWHINDLHSGNFGYTKDGKAKIIDYSGYA